MIAWHWIRDDKKTRYDERPIRAGRMHGSKKILDALHFAPDLRLENQRIT